MRSGYPSSKRALEIERRVQVGESGYPRCIVLDCRHPTAARVRRGLNRNYCTAHTEHYKRHGSYSKASYKAAQLNPMRAASRTWIDARQTAPEVQEALDKVRTLLWRGTAEEAFRLAGRSPEERSRIVWARLRMHRVDASEVLAIWMAVELCHLADDQPERKPHFRHVQAGKALHRLSGGSHKYWEREMSDGRIERTELHKYPVSRGRVLVHLGRSLAAAAQPITSRLTEVQLTTD